jgi:hypothetical protein
MLDLADPHADLIHFWDDDDLHLPWHLEDCLQQIDASVAWKPASYWVSQENVRFSRTRTGSKAPGCFGPITCRSCRFTLTRLHGSSRLPANDRGGAARHHRPWGGDFVHLSLGKRRRACQRYRPGREHRGSPAPKYRGVASRSNDVRADGQLVPADLAPRWRGYLDGIRASVSWEEWERNREWLDPKKT